MKKEKKTIIKDDKLLLNEIRRASSCGEFTIAKELVKGVVDIDQALKWCSQYGDLDSVKYLAEKGADISANGYESVTWAIYKNHLAIFQYFVIERNIDVSQFSDILNSADALQDTIKWGKEYKERVDFKNKMHQDLAGDKKIDIKRKI